MFDIILVVVIVLAACGAYIYRSSVKQRLLDELAGSYNEATLLVKSCTGEKLPAEFKKALHHPLRELTVSLRKLEECFGSELAVLRMRQILKEDKPLVEEKCKEIREICLRWNSYARFKEQLTEALSEAYSRSNELTDKIHTVVRYDKAYQETVQVRASAVLTRLEEYQAMCREMNSISFANYTTDQQVPGLTEEFSQEVEILNRELQYFNRSIKIVITGLYRKSVYYINLEDSTEISNRRYAGRVQVSYKTFREVKKGDSYKWEIIISGKHTTSEQNVTFKFLKGDQQTSITHKIEKNQFEEIFKAIKFNRKFEETDENGIPYQINALDLNVLVCEKKAFEFDVSYGLEIFKNTSIYDFLSYNTNPLDLSADNDNDPPPDEDKELADSALVPAKELRNASEIL